MPVLRVTLKQEHFLAGMSWGNGFTINQTLIQQYNLSDPSGFFEDISAVPVLVNRTMLSVHIYGPNITVRPSHGTFPCDA